MQPLQSNDEKHCQFWKKLYRCCNQQTPYKQKTTKKSKQPNARKSVKLIKLNTFYAAIVFCFPNRFHIVGAPKKNHKARIGSHTAQPAEDEESRYTIGLPYK